MTQQMRRAFRRLPAEMLKVVQTAARLEQQGHLYQNRTGNLERSTVGRPVSSPGFMNDDATVMLEMGMYYASYVNNLGYSRIDDAAKIAEFMIASLMTQGWPQD